MNDSGVWWLLAGAVVVAELVTGTFYLLMMAVGLVAGALTAHAGFELTAQLLVAALFGGGGVAVWHFKRSQRPKPADASANPDVLLDIGAQVTVTEWFPDGTAQVKFRGALWSAVAAHGTDNAKPGAYTITEVHGNRLTLSQSAVRTSQQIHAGDSVA
jgi:membrane protein implicated in regulation of membrane protease activity